MKESKFYNDEFEELIRQKTDQYKMYPSDKVWKEIYNSLHTRRRRFIIGMSVLISGILVIAGKELLTPAKNMAVTRKAVATDVSKPNPQDIAAAFQAFKKVDLTQAVPVIPDKLAIRQIIPFAILADQGENKVPSPSADYNNLPVEQIPDDIPKYISANISIEKTAAEVNTDLAEPSPKSGSDISNIGRKDLGVYNESDKKQMDWLQEYAMQHLTPIKKNKFTWQIYVSPTVNYRSLSGVDYSRVRSTIQNVPIALVHFGNVNDFVDHTPAVGYEFGGSMLYKLTRNLSFKAGLQFNYSRYIIRAFNSNPELATIQLNSYYGYLADSITGYTNVRNFSGKSSENLQNKYYQLSAPIGLEMRIIGNGKLQFNIAGTIQPTYLLNRNSYILTTDYVNYTKEASLFRRWNVNGGLEAFLSYEIGGLRWQIGPQFRYQLLSTYTDKYPIKENLIEYGFKIGISKIIR